MVSSAVLISSSPHQRTYFSLDKLEPYAFF